MKLKRYILLLSSALFGMAALIGCNTSEGFGEDVEDAGEGIQEQAD